MLTPLSADALLLTFAVLIPLLGAVLLPLHTHRRRWREMISLITSGLLLLVVIQLLDVYYAGGRPNALLVELLPDLFMNLALRPIGLVFALLSSFLWLITTLYSIGYLRANNEQHQTRYYVCFAVSMAATIGIAFSGNLLTLFIFYELLTLATYPLVVHHGTETAMRAGRTYLGILMSASLLLLFPAILIVWHLVENLEFTRGGIMPQASLLPWQTGGLLLLFVFGFAKAALMPLHRWLPAAMVAPTPVSALLHAVAVVKAGVYGIVITILAIFGSGQLLSASQNNWMAGSWLVYLAGATVLLASIVALREDNLKRRLAYSTVGQLSYVIMGVALFTPLAIAGAVLHLVAHAFGKITLFFAAGSIATASGKKQVSELAGIGRAMPWTMGAFAIGSLSLIGLPPAVGFLSKWYILQGAMQQEHYFALFVIIVGTLLNAAYLLPILYSAFQHDAPSKHGEAPRLMVAMTTSTAACCLLLFFHADWLLAIVREALPLWEPMMP